MLATSVIGVVVAACGGGGRAGPASTPGPDGRSLFVRMSCGTCHSVDGRPGAAPTLKGIAGATVVLSDGRSVVRDDAYLQEAIRDPDASIVNGFPPGLMARAVPRGSLTEQETDQLVAYIKTLR